jgi:protein-tyrosine phosphatase
MRIDLDGTANTRDVGGLPTVAGGSTAWRRLLRSDNLQDLSARDVRRLVDDYGVRTVVDLRSELEVGTGPLDRSPEVTVANLALRRNVTGRRGFAGVYLGFLAERPDAVVAALRLIAYGPGAAVVHCTAGKDRTGVVVALALADVGVERAAIVADYAASGEYFAAVVSRLAAARRVPELSRAAALEHAPRAVTMERFLDGVVEEFGGVGEWLGGNGWTVADHEALRRRLLD